MNDKTWYEEVKEEFTKNITDKHILNLAISILDDRESLMEESLKQIKIINKAIEWVENNKYYFPEPTELLNILKGVAE